MMDHYFTHTLQTFRTYSEDESNFFKERRDKGVREAARGKHQYYKALDK